VSNLSELLPAGGGQNNFTFTASGAISNGDVVVLNSDGTVSTATSATNFIGLAGQAISNGAEGTINVLGSLNESQSSLTIGSDYYVQSNGSLGTTVTNTKVGKAISATQINMKNRS